MVLARRGWGPPEAIAPTVGQSAGQLSRSEGDSSPPQPFAWPLVPARSPRRGFLAPWLPTLVLERRKGLSPWQAQEVRLRPDPVSAGLNVGISPIASVPVR